MPPVRCRVSNSSLTGTDRMKSYDRGSSAVRHIPSSGQPALAALVALHLAERLAVTLRYTEVEFLHVLVLAQHMRKPVHHHAAGFENVSVGGVFERHVGVLLCQQ